MQNQLFDLKQSYHFYRELEPDIDTASSGLLQFEKCDDTAKQPVRNSTRTGIYRQVSIKTHLSFC